MRQPLFLLVGVRKILKIVHFGCRLTWRTPRGGPAGDPRKIRECVAAEERLRNLKNCTVFGISAARRGFEKIVAGGGGYRCIRRVSLYAGLYRFVEAFWVEGDGSPISEIMDLRE